MNQNQKKRILIIASAAGSLKSFRGDFIKDLTLEGYKVYAAAPGIEEYKETYKFLTDLNVTPLNLKLQRSGLNPIKDFKSIKALKKLIKENKIDLVFPYTIKPVVYGSIAANSLNVPVISLITGLGYTFSGVSKKAKVLQKFSQVLYRKALKTNNLIVFQNIDDYQLFLDKKIMTENQKYGIVSGSGINLDQYKFRKKSANGTNIEFVFVARLIREKGINLYIEAAKKLKSKYPQAKFHILGKSPQGSPSAIDNTILENENKKGTIIQHGWVNNVQEFLSDCHVFVLPTFYREGVPRSILEALSIGMPIITTNTPGCKETIIKNQNGILIEPRNLDSLIDALEFFINNSDKIEEMGINSRKYAEKRFDVNIINRQLISSIKDVLA
ncbi:glycosyltransferase family 1 protein [Algibacter marinivivus]|uniref:Glycosyltransferase family 1 protein n=1 Tax=Algibacter marinivivus TaxID=2100723 RepID=A0A2U2X3R0_9FLAO|nr:glycosyltransferase family 4 protein [Algibacter marinivivus]PWH82400.1 glycosyltransferase family 1 protein [Algibacter marinivivus]